MMVPEEGKIHSTVLSFLENILLRESSFNSEQRSQFRVSTSHAKSLKTSLSTLESSIQSLKFSMLGETPKELELEFQTPLDTSCSESPEQSDGYSIDRFISPIDPSVICLNCQKVVANPKECKDCQGLICSRCANQINFCPKGCPLGTFRRPLSVIFSFLDSLHIRCSFKHQGCCKVSTLGEIESHEDECQFKTVKCLNPICDTLMVSYELEEKLYCSDLCTLVGRFQSTLKYKEKALALQEIKKIILLAPSFLYDEARREKREEYTKLENIMKKY